jgi:hypothetical protein
MGEIVGFNPRAGLRRSPEPPGPQGAQILFFLGVRYERHQENETAGRTRARKPQARPSIPAGPRRRKRQA